MKNDSPVLLSEKIKQKKLLFVCPYFPNRSNGKAGHKLAWYNLKDLLKVNEVDLLVVSHEVGDVNLLPPGIGQVHYVAVGKVFRILGIFLNLLNKGVRYSSRMGMGASRSLSNIVSLGGYQHIHFEFSQCIPLMKLAGSMPLPSTSAVFHDVIIQATLRSKIWLESLFVRSTFECEGHSLEKIGQIFVLCRKDAMLIGSMYGVHYPLVIDLMRTGSIYSYAPKVGGVAREFLPPAVAFFGAMSRSENELAVRYFLDFVWKDIFSSNPNAVWYIVGSAPTRYILSLNGKFGIRVTGFVADPSDIFSQVLFAVVPLLSGAGIKFKTLELLNSGLKVISTPIGAEGIDPHPFLYVASGQSFKELVSDEFK